MMDTTSTPLVEMKNVSISFGGIHAVDDASVDQVKGGYARWRLDKATFVD